MSAAIGTVRLNTYIKMTKRGGWTGVALCAVLWVIILAGIGFTGGEELIEKPWAVVLRTLLAIGTIAALGLVGTGSVLSLGAELLLGVEQARIAQTVTQNGRALTAVDSVR